MRAETFPVFPWNINSPGQNTGVGSLSLLQAIFPTQGSNPGLPHCRRILYQLSHKGSPRILEWVTYPFSSRSSQELNWGLLHSLPTELSGKPLIIKGSEKYPGISLWWSRNNQWEIMKTYFLYMESRRLLGYLEEIPLKFLDLTKKMFP